MPGPLGVGEADDELVVGHRAAGARPARGRRRRAAVGGHVDVIRSGLRLGLAGCLARRGELVAHHVAAGLLERPIERRLEQVRVVEVEDVGAADDPQPDALLAPAEQLAGVVDGELGVGRHDAAAVAHRVAVLLLPEDLPGLEDRRLGVGRVRRRDRRHAAAGTPRIASRTQRVSSRASRRNSRRSCDIGPWPVTTVRSSSQSGSRVAPLRRSPRRGAGPGPG